MTNRPLSQPAPTPVADPSADAALVCVAQFVGAHGVQGLAKVRSFTDDPAALAEYGPLTDDTGRAYTLEIVGEAKGNLLCVVDGIDDRDAAQALNGVKLYIPRAALPALEDEDSFYHADLIGCSLVLPDGAIFGTVRAVHDFGAGDTLEVQQRGGGSVFVPFTKATIPVVDIAARRLTFHPPKGLLAKAKAPGDGNGDGFDGEAVDGDADDEGGEAA